MRWDERGNCNTSCNIPRHMVLCAEMNRGIAKHISTYLGTLSCLEGWTAGDSMTAWRLTLLRLLWRLYTRGGGGGAGGRSALLCPPCEFLPGAGGWAGEGSHCFVYHMNSSPGPEEERMKVCTALSTRWTLAHCLSRRKEFWMAVSTIWSRAPVRRRSNMKITNIVFSNWTQARVGGVSSPLRPLCEFKPRAKGWVGGGLVWCVSQVTFYVMP